MRADIARAAGHQHCRTIVHVSLAVLSVRRPALVEQQIQRARIGGQIAPEQPARLQPDPPRPFQPGGLHPARRAGAASRQEVEQSAGCLDDADIEKTRREFLDKGLLVGHAERDPQIIRRQRVDLVDLGAQRIALQIAVRMSDDQQIRVHLPDIGDGERVFRLIGAEHVEGQARRGGLARDDVKQVGGRDALGQRRL